MLPQLNQVVLKTKANCWVCPLALSPATAKAPKASTDVTSVHAEKSAFVKNIQTWEANAGGNKRKRSKADALLSTLDACVMIMLHHV